MPGLRLNLGPITPGQLRRLQQLWRAWIRGLHLTRERDRHLRHAYVEIVTRGRARQTKELTAAEAARVIRRLERATRPRRTAYDYVLGTAGRRGYEEQRDVRVTPAALGLLDRYAAALGMTPARLDRFIAAHYAGAGLRGRADIHTMADLNRVLWGLKALLRRTVYAPAQEKAKKRAA